MTKLASPRRLVLGRVADTTIYLVDGEKVRDDVDVDFTNGGNEARYHYIPRREIWIDDAQHALDRTATALHELIERDLMLRHGMSYDAAHDAANGHERAFRRDLVRNRPARFDLRQVAEAYRVYARETNRQKRAKQLDREIAQALSGRAAGRVGIR